jgi:hypothetical protein
VIARILLLYGADATQRDKVGVLLTAAWLPLRRLVV